MIVGRGKMRKDMRKARETELQVMQDRTDTGKGEQSDNSILYYTDRVLTRMHDN